MFLKIFSINQLSSFLYKNANHICIASIYTKIIVYFRIKSTLSILANIFSKHSHMIIYLIKIKFLIIF